jgi:preprotein translocase subunit SecE
MANEEKKAPVPSKGGAVKKTDKKPGIFKRIRKWFRDMKSDLKKVVWPTPGQILNNTIVALSVMAVTAVILWGFDTLASNGVKAIITLVG